jgi:uncharacterized protein YecE (DUF72 family)
MAGRIVVGTSGWTFDDWYPPKLTARERLAYYGERFEGVEVDSTFYALPARRTVTSWEQATPEGFTFDMKLHRLLSRHAAPLSSLPTELRDRARLNERGRVMLDGWLEREMCRRTLDAAEPLRQAGKLSSFLLQLTPAFRPEDHRLGELEPVVAGLAPVPVAVELRHRGWLREREQTLAWLRAAGVAFVCVDAPRVKAPNVLPPVDAVTRDDLAYLRAHGRNADGYLKGASATERFAWRYSQEELLEIATRARALARDAAHVRLMFGNGPDAPAAAQRMRSILAQPGTMPSGASARSPARERRRGSGTRRSSAP